MITQSKNHICFIGTHEYYRQDQTVRIAKISENIDLYNGQRLCSRFVCYLNAWTLIKSRIESGHITV